MIKERFKKIDYRHYICAAITVIFLLCSVFLFSDALGRIVEGLRDLGISVVFYFCELFKIPHDVSPTVNKLPKAPYFKFLSGKNPATSLPDSFSGFRQKWSAYWRRFVSGKNAVAYLAFLSGLLYNLSFVIMVVMPFVLLFRILFGRYMQNENNDYNKDSRPLKIFRSYTKNVYMPVRGWIVSFVSFVRRNGVYFKFWLFIWAWNFNVITIVLEFFAFYFYLVASFDFVSIYRQVYKLFLDLSVPIEFIPPWCWAVVALIFFDKFRKKIAVMRLNHMERCNRGFINERPILSMACGTMGKSKTTLITDMSISQAIMFRDKAFEMILDNDLKFPFFPWINLENETKQAIEKHSVYNLATCKKFVGERFLKWLDDKTSANLFDYDYEKYGLFYDDKLKEVNIWNVIEIYTQLYFIFVVQSSLLLANYSIRADFDFIDLGNFPRWNMGLFQRDSKHIEAYSRHAHILDFDSLRLGKKVLKNNSKKDSFEFGVVVITEIGKERGNNLENNDKKRSDADTNQKNDLFNETLKMIRHKATVDNFPFVKVIADEQRPESWGADARDLCEVMYVRDKSDVRLAMPFFSLEELLHSWLFGKFAGLYTDYRFVRGDNTLLMHLVKSAAAKLHNYRSRIYNRFSYYKLSLQIEGGTLDGKYKDSDYYLMPKKIYSRRFSTDCYSEFFSEKTLRSLVGLPDLDEYETEKASFEEMSIQNSYFINKMQNMEKDGAKND